MADYEQEISETEKVCFHFIICCLMFPVKFGAVKFYDLLSVHVYQGTVLFVVLEDEVRG